MATAGVSVMAHLGDLCRTKRAARTNQCFSVWGQNNKGKFVKVTITGAKAGEIASLQNGVGHPLLRYRATSVGEAYFYNLDDGDYYVNCSGDLWYVSIVLGVVTVVQLYASSRTVGKAFFA